VKDNSKIWIVYFIIFMFVGVYGPLGIVFSYVYKTFQDKGGYTILLTEEQSTIYMEAKSNQGKLLHLAQENEYIPQPRSQALISVYEFVTNVKFDGAIMVLIIIDNVVLSLEHYRMSAAFETNVGLVRPVILILFIVEMLLKLVAWRRYFFSSWWNWLDIFVVATGISGKFKLYRNYIFKTEK